MRASRSEMVRLARAHWPTWTWMSVGGVLGAFLVVALVLLAGSAPYEMVGNPDPGALTRIGTPLLRFVANVAAALCTGGLAFAVCFVVPAASGTVAPEGYLALRRSGRWALVWFAAALLLVPFDTANTTGQPVTELSSLTSLFGLVDALQGPKAWLLTAALALVIALGCRATLRWQPTVVLLAVSVFAVLPPLAAGHVSSDTGHDIATTALMVHVAAAAVWVGASLSLIIHLWRGDRLPEATGQRYSRLTVVCAVAVAISGGAAGWWLVPPQHLVTTGYGAVLLAKIGALVLIAVVAAVLRRRVLAGSAHRARVVRVASVELAALLVTVGASAALTHLKPASLADDDVSGQQTLLGYDLPGPPTWSTLALEWRLDALFTPLAILFAAAYLVGVVRLHRRGLRWPWGRTAAWLAGCLVLLVATSSGLGTYATAMLSMHMTAHMLSSMLAPVLLALGGPLTLLQRARTATSALPGPHEWVRTLRDSRLMTVLTHPLVVLALFAGTPFALYFTSLFDSAMRFHWAHQAITGSFLVFGYLFAWVVIGVDRLPRPMPNLARIGLLLAAMPAQVVLSALMMNTERVIGDGPAGANMYTALALPWVPDLLADQWLAGVIALVICEITLFAALVVLVARWREMDEDTDSGFDETPLLTAVAEHRR